MASLDLRDCVWHQELVRNWLFTDELVPLPETPVAEKATCERVEHFREVLDKICGYHLFKIVDIREEAQEDEDVELSGLVQGTCNPLLRHVLNGIFNSTTVKATAKLPLAIKYNDRLAVRTCLDRQGVHVLAKGEELAADARMLLYAAFCGHADIVKELVEAGSDITQLDHLIMLEIQPELEMAAPKKVQKRREEAEVQRGPPALWIKDRRIEHAKVQANSCADRGNAARVWSSITADEQMKTLTEEWAAIDPDEQRKLRRKYKKMVDWDRLSLVNGWSYRVVWHHVAGTAGAGEEETAAQDSKARLKRSRSTADIWAEQQRALQHSKLDHGSSLRVVASRKTTVATEVDLTTVGANKPITCTGTVISASEAHKFMGRDLPLDEMVRLLY